MAHSENSEEYSSPYQFFFYLYDKRNVSITPNFLSLIPFLKLRSLLLILFVFSCSLA